MESVLWFIGIAIVSSIIFSLQQRAISQPGHALAKKFAALGTIAGKSKQEIIKAVGQPTAFSALTENQSLLQWQATGYHIALLFTGEVCDGITHEHRSET